MDFGIPDERRALRTAVADVAAGFGNDRDVIIGGGKAAGRKLCQAAMSVWTSFAASGDPNNPRIPSWPKYDMQDRATLIFDDPVIITRDPNRDLRLFWDTQPPASSVWA